VDGAPRALNPRKRLPASDAGPGAEVDVTPDLRISFATEPRTYLERTRREVHPTERHPRNAAATDGVAAGPRKGQWGGHEQRSYFSTQVVGSKNVLLSGMLSVGSVSSNSMMPP